MSADVTLPAWYKGARKFAWRNKLNGSLIFGEALPPAFQRMYEKVTVDPATGAIVVAK